MQETEPESLRFLNVLQKKQEHSRSRTAYAISFGQFRKGAFYRHAQVFVIINDI
jgi:hypothetical protein